MVRGGDINIGTCLLINGNPHIVVEREFVSPGKGSAFARVKAKGLKSGNVITQTIKTADSVEDAQVDLVDCQYQYSDGENYMFMNNESFEQFGEAQVCTPDLSPILLLHIESGSPG